MPSVSFASTSTHTVPVELYHHIFSHLNLPTLLTLSTLSHTFHLEAQRIIYTSIDLRQRTYAQIRSWAETIRGTDNDDRRLARLVRTLTLPETLKWRYKTSSWEVMEFRKVLAGALKAMPNLAELNIVAQEGMSRGNPYLNLWMLEGCSFRLRKFHNEGDALYYPGRPSQFYEEQTEMRDWMPGYLEIGARIPEDVPDFSSSSRIFPHLEKIHLRDPQLLQVLNLRPLTSITIDTTRHGLTKREALRLLDNLSLYHRQLVELRLITEGPSYAIGDGITGSGWWEPMSVIGHIPEKLPELKVLGYSQMPSYYAVSRSSIPLPVEEQTLICIRDESGSGV